ncbi:MAG: non-homologous end joining protein Ku [Burkholderiaceae bacterium]
MPRAIASLSLSFGLVSIPVKLYSATESSSAIRFKLMRDDGSHVRQQYLADAPIPPRDTPSESTGGRPTGARVATPLQASNVRPFTKVSARLVREEIEETEEDEEDGPGEAAVVERRDLVKGYEVEKGKFVLFTSDDLKALQEGARKTIDIVSFVPQASIDPIYYDKAYFLAPDKRGEKPYSLLHAALRSSGRCAIAKWAWRSKQYVVQVRAAEDGLVLQQLLYAEEVRSLRELNIRLVPAEKAELQLALQLIAHISEDAFDATQFVDEEKQRILAAVEQKVAGRQIVAPGVTEGSGSAQVIDLMAALRASLKSIPGSRQAGPGSTTDIQTGPRKAVRRSAKSTEQRAKPRKAAARK